MQCISLQNIALQCIAGWGGCNDATNTFALFSEPRKSWRKPMPGLGFIVKNKPSTF
jgi:hypothetical protein